MSLKTDRLLVFMQPADYHRQKILHEVFYSVVFFEVDD